MAAKVKILIADDHPIFRKGLRQVIEGMANVAVIGEACEGKETLASIREYLPDIAVVDMDMPGMTGLEVARAVHEDDDLATRILILTMYKEEDLFNTALDYGVVAYLLKENAVSEIVSAIQSVLAGKYYISPSISGFLVNRKHKGDELSRQKPGLETLTSTERKIMGLIAKGMLTREIAGELSVSYKTIENHRGNIIRKLDLHGSHALLKFALENKAAL